MTCLPLNLSLINSPSPASVTRLRPLEAFAESWPSDPESYQLLYKIGNGASGSVYQALCPQLQATVAVKRLNLDTNSDLGALLREASLLRRFQHKHVLLLHTSFVVGRELWMVMPYMDLGSVRAILRRAFPQGFEEAVIATIMRSVLLGLEYVHKNGGMHRDIKAANILVSRRGEVRLADFGAAAEQPRNLSIILSRVLRPPNGQHAAHGAASGIRSSAAVFGTRHVEEARGAPAGTLAGAASAVAGAVSTSGGSGSSAGWQDLPAALAALRAKTFVGTPCWMAPEVMQQLNEGYDSAADIWSFGITLLELATGLPPLARCHPIRVLADTVNLPPPSLPGESGRKFSRAFRDLVALCLQKDPSKRPTASELLQHRFFKGAKDPAALVLALTSHLLAPGGASATDGSGVLPALARSGASAPAAAAAARQPGSITASLAAAGARGRPRAGVVSEPNMLARLWSALSLATSTGGGAGALLGPRLAPAGAQPCSSRTCSRRGGGAGSISGSGGSAWWRLDSSRSRLFAVLAGPAAAAAAGTNCRGFKDVAVSPAAAAVAGEGHHAAPEAPQLAQPGLIPAAAPLQA